MRLDNLNANFSVCKHASCIALHSEICIWSKSKLKEGEKMTLVMLCWIYFVDLNSFIGFVFVLAGAASLKIKLAKQINHMMRRLADCCCSPPPLHFYWHFFPPSLLKLQLSRHKGPCGLDQMFQAAHFPTLCLMEYSWATRHRSTAPCRTDQSPLIY